MNNILLLCFKKTYSDDHKVKPAPSVREIFLEAVGSHLDNHFKDEYNGVHFIHYFQYLV